MDKRKSQKNKVVKLFSGTDVIILAAYILSIREEENTSAISHAETSRNRF